jgi:hypothetical protein
MENVSVQQQIDFMRNQMEQQAAQLHELRGEAATRSARRSDDVAELAEDIAQGIAPHLQLAPADTAERKRILNTYPKVHLPKVLRDDNGLAAQAIGPDSAAKKLVLERLPAIQWDNLDTVRVAAAAWQQTRFMAQHDPAAALQFVYDALRDIISLSCDSAQRAAQAQLKQTLESAGHSGAYALIDLSPGTQQLDFEDCNILQPSHLEALVEIKQFKATITATRVNKPQGGGQPNGRGHGGGKGGGRGNSYGNGKGKGGGRGGGYGKGKGGKGSGNASSPSPSPMQP